MADRPPCLVLKEDGTCADRWPVHPPGPAEPGGEAVALPEPKMSMQDIARRKATVARGAGATLGDHVYFAGDDGKHGIELLRTDGERVELVKDISAGTEDTSIERVLSANGLVYFVVVKNDLRSLWRTDGTEAGTRLLDDLGATSNSPAPVFAIGTSRLFYVSVRAAEGVMSTDGNKVELAYAPNGAFSRVRGLAAAGDVLYAMVSSTGSAADETELVRIDAGVETTLKKYRDIAAGAPSMGPAPLVVSGSSVYFMVADLETGTELWRSDGTSGGTTRVLPAVGAQYRPAYETQLAAHDGQVYFYARKGAGTELCVVDATGPRPLLETRYAFPLEVTDKGVFFVGDDAETSSLYVTNGATTTRVATRARRVLGTHRDKVYFDVLDDRLGIEPWVSDGTPDGTRPLGDLRKGALSSDARGLGFTRSGYVFSAFDDVGDAQLWTTDGTADGTRPVARTNANSIGSAPSGIGILPSGAAIFFADDGQTGERAWLSDGTAEGTKPISPAPKVSVPSSGGAFSSMASSVAVLGGDAWFVATSDAGTARLYRSNGSPTGTKSFPIASPGWGARVTAVKDAIYVTDNADRVFYFDGTIAVPLPLRSSYGTLVNDGRRIIATSAASAMIFAVEASEPTPIVQGIVDVDILGALPLDGRTVFASRLREPPMTSQIYATEGDMASTVELTSEAESDKVHRGASVLTVLGQTALVEANGTLYTTDGTRAHTAPFLSDVELHASRGYAEPRAVAYRGAAYFSATIDRKTGIYKTNGTKEGTVAVAVFEAPLREGPPADLVVFRDRVWFTAYARDGGRELYSTDGTESGTRRERDISEGARGSYPSSFAVARDVMWFAADDYKNGRELYRMK